MIFKENLRKFWSLKQTFKNKNLSLHGYKNIYKYIICCIKCSIVKHHKPVRELAFQQIFWVSSYSCTLVSWNKMLPTSTFPPYKRMRKFSLYGYFQFVLRNQIFYLSEMLQAAKLLLECYCYKNFLIFQEKQIFSP